MKLPTASFEESQKFAYSRQSILNALRELTIDFREGPKEAVMQCFVTDACATGKRSLYVNILDKPGVWHCFKCNERGYFAQLIAYATHWGEFKLVAFLHRHRATATEYAEATSSAPQHHFTEADVLEGRYAYRHAYCYDRGLSEDTLRRYRIGYDREENDIIIPWFNRVGKLTAIKRRAVASKYYRFECNESISPLLFGLHLVRPHCLIWISEGEFDTMFIDQIFRSRKVTGHGSVGLGGKYLSGDALAQLLLKSPTMIVLALDNDVDGDKAASAIEMQLAGIVPTYRMRFESGVKDPNESSIEHIINQKQVADQLLNLQTAFERTRYKSFLDKETKQHERLTGRRSIP